MVKHLPTMWETWVRSLGWEGPLEKEMATHSSTFDWKIPWTEDPGRLQDHGVAESDMTEWLHFHFQDHVWASLVAQLVKNPPVMWETWVWSLHWEDSLKKGNYPLQYSGLENSMNCIGHGVAKSRTWLSDFHFTLRPCIWVEASGSKSLAIAYDCIISH